MRIPRTVKVGGHIYAVLFPHLFVERTDLTGQSCHGTNTIRIADKTQNGEKKPRSGIEETFLHELIHCVDVVYNANKLDEETVSRLSEGLFQVLSDNGLLAPAAMPQADGAGE